MNFTRYRVLTHHPYRRITSFLIKVEMNFTRYRVLTLTIFSTFAGFYYSRNELHPLQGIDTCLNLVCKFFYETVEMNFTRYRVLTPSSALPISFLNPCRNELHPLQGIDTFLSIFASSSSIER